MFLLLSCLFCVLFMNAQNKLSFKIDSVQQIKDTKVKKEGFKEILQQQDTSIHTENLGTLYQELGNCYYKQKEYDKAFNFIIKAVKIREEYKNLEKFNESRYKLAAIYNKQKEPQKRYDILIEIINDYGTDKSTNNAHRVLGKIERNRGDFYKSIYFLELGFLNKSHENLKYENLKYENLFRFDIITTYAKKYQSTFNVDHTNTDLQKVERHQNIIEKNSAIDATSKLRLKDVAALHNGIAVVYDSFQELEKALYYYKKALDYYSEKNEKYQELEVVNNIGIIYSKQGKYELAYKLYNRVLKESTDEDQRAMAYDNMGYYLPNTSAKTKVSYFQKAIHTILKKEINQEFQLPTLAEIKRSGYEQDVLIYLIDLAAHYVQAFKQENDRLYLIKAKEAVTLIDQLVSLIRYETDTEASKLFWIEKGVNTYMLAVEICYLLEDTPMAFYFMEKNKALLLQENIKTLQTKLALNIPTELLEREYQLHYDILALQEAFQQNIENEAWKETYSLKNKEYQTYMDSMKHMYPEYIKTKQKVEITSLNTVIAEFETKETAFVEYILHETDGYGIYYDVGTPIFFKIKDVSAFQKQLEELQTFMTKRTMDTSELKAYQEIGFTIFEQLFPFENAAKRLKDKKLTIITDQTLQYIPFEILPMQQSGKLSEVYLVNSVETSYLQSFSLFHQIKQKQNSPTQKLLAIAPYEFEDSTLPTLTGTEKVLEFLSKYDSSILLTKEEASKENFLKYRNDFEIIHLNTHAGLDTITQTPWIAFNKEKMSLTELFGLENQANLVILDACKTNNGVNLSGEGLINLSRGFFYNGTQSVLASQWNVNEQAGNKILQEFYTEIEKGTSKSKALQLAKKAYLQQHDHLQNIPYYWAAFTLTGSTNSVSLQPVQNYTYIVVGITILLFVLLFFYYRKTILAKAKHL